MKKIHILNHNNVINEGGAARNNGFYKFLKSKKYIHIMMNNNKISNLLKFLKVLIFTKESQIVFHYPMVFVPMKSKVLRRIYIKVLKFSSKRNLLVIDVHDLPYEQAIDLKLPIYDFIPEFEKDLFLLNCKFYFASKTMMEYAKKKYNIKSKNIGTIINAGIDREKQDYELLRYNFIDEEKINIVYAGTLNKGRNIENLIENVIGLDNINLILMGINGEWIEDKYINNKNIKYIGSKSEDECHKICSICDIGLIPYDDSKLYYNLCCPTKLAFYTTAGIPILSTDTKETSRIINKWEIGWCYPLSKWNEFFKTITKLDLVIKKKKVNEDMENFTWNNILKKVEEFNNIG